MSCRLGKGLALAVAMAIGSGVAPSDATEPDSAPPNRPVSGARAGYSPELPPQLEREELGLIADLLVLSPEQEALLTDTLYERYLTDDARHRERVLPDLIRRGQDLHELKPYTDPVAAEALAEFRSDCDREGGVLARMLIGVLGRLEPFLTEDQAQRLPRCRAVWTRRVTRSRGRSFRPADVDLVLLLNATLNDLETSILPEPQRQVAALFDEYDAALTPKAVARYRHWGDISKQWYRIKAAAAMERLRLPDQDSEIRQRARDQIRAARKPYVRSCQEMYRINRYTLAQLIEVVGVPIGSELQRSYNHLAFPTVFPDPHDVTKVINEVIEQVDADVAKEVSELFADAQARDKLLIDQMIQESVEWNLAFILNGAIYSDDYRMYRERMRAFDDTRAANAQGLSTILLDVVPEVSRADIRTALEQHEAKRVELVARRSYRAVGAAEWPFPHD